MVATKSKGDIGDKELIELMIGRKVSDKYLERKIANNKILELKGISSKKGINDINFSLFKGEILGFTGIVGSGRTEVARVLFGIDQPTEGEIFLNGEPIKFKSPIDAINNGIAMVPEDRINEGILPELNVMENIILASLEKFTKLGIKNRKKQINISKKMISDLSIKTPTYKQLLKYLSGGNLQKVLLVKWLNTDVKIILLDEPTNGIDIAGKSDIHNLVA